MKKRVPPRVQKFPAAKQRRLDQLLEKNSDGTITLKEQAILEQLVADAQDLMVANARRLAEFSKSQNARPPTSAEPVTVWVQSNAAEC